jgi:predicted ATP-grasp superfamily ATP-dependent carboligase
VTRLRVLVLDADKRQALAACRALGRAGHEVAAAGEPETALAGWSRYTARYHQIPSSRGPAAPYADALRALVADHSYEAVVAVEDPSVVQLAEAHLETPTVPLVGPALERLTDKVALGDLAARADTLYPTTELAPEVGLDGVIERLGAPVVVKPSRSAALVDDTVRHYSGASMADGPDALVAAAARIGRAGLVPLVQSRIERADKINVTIVRSGGLSEVRFPYRVLRDVPLTGGIAVTLETVSADRGVGAEAVAALERVCDAAGYEGVANGEFCVSRADGRLYLIEVNTRPWGSLWFAERLGQRVSDRIVRQALGLPTAPAGTARAGRRYHNPAGERRWVRLHARRLRPFVSVVRSTRPWDSFEYLDLSDRRATLRYALDKLRGGSATPEE